MTNWKQLSLRLFCFFAVPWFGIVATIAAEPSFDHFITTHDGRLFDGGKEFRFISWNIPNLLIIEDNFEWQAPHDWLLPDAFELNDAFATVSQLGGTVVRSYSIPVERSDEIADIPKYVRGIGKFDEKSFRTMDLALKLANENHVRLIIPLVNNWPWQGGRADYAAWESKPADAFWTDPQIILDFEKTIRYVLNRTNTLTGVRYADDKAILCWETGNELRGETVGWLKTISAFIKDIDPHHLVMDGYDAGIRPEILALPDVDIVTTHHYPSSQDPRSVAQQIRDDAAVVNGRKAYIIGEFGFFKTGEMADAIKAIMESRDSGGLLWSLRFRNRNGGFYWHSEPDGANLYRAFHWPGSAAGAAYDEINLTTLVRSDAYAIRGLAEPVIPVPAPPTLLPITDAGEISWQGSVAATGYEVERAVSRDADWRVIATNADEAMTQYHPLFADENVPAGTWYYRVRARNGSGTSEPSNIAGPVEAKWATLVDDFADLSKTASRTGDWTIATGNCRVTREDASRAAGNAGDTLVYHLSSSLHAFRVFAFFPKTVSAVKFYDSVDGEIFREIAVQTEDDFRGRGDYGYWEPVLYHAEDLHSGTFLKIQLTGETQLGRAEISHATLNP